MGASYISHSYKKCSVQELEARVDSSCQKAAHECGRSYSGDWGEKIGAGLFQANKSFNTYQEADNWLADNCDKWGPLVAVKVLEKPAKTNTGSLDKKLEAAKEKLNTMLIELGDRHSSASASARPLIESILARVKSAKSKLKGCDSCGSKIATAHLNRQACPVCGDKTFLLTETDKKKFDRLKEKIATLKSEIESLEAKRKSIIETAVEDKKNEDNWYWLVGGSCSS